MPTITDYLKYAEASLAAYAESLDPTTSTNALRYVLAEMTSAQAEQYDAAWKVIWQSTGRQDGFSAVLLQHNSTKEKVISIRGTELSAGGIDLVVDLLHIGAVGSATFMAQYYALENFYRDLLQNAWVSPGEKVSITGHSLGGFLAQAFTVRNPEAISMAYTYNSPGFGGSLYQMYEFLRVSDASSVNSKVVNVRAFDGISLSAGWGQVVGSVQEVRIEGGTPNPITYHSITTLTDALSVFKAFSELQPDISVDQVGDMFCASGKGTARLERFLDTLRTVFIGPASNDANRTPIGSRDNMFTNLYALVNSAAYVEQKGHVRFVSNNLAEQALLDTQTALAYRYALLELNSYAVVASSEARNQSLYSHYDTRLELQTGTREGRISESWVRDRAEMVEVLAVQNRQNIPGVVTGIIDGRSFSDAVIYLDVASQTTIRTGTYSDGDRRHLWFGGERDDTYSGAAHHDRLYGGAGNDRLDGAAGNDRIEGNEGSDRLVGGFGADTLIGGASNDTLDGGQGNDWLKGGDGLDTYRFQSGWGSDIIDDTGVNILEVDDLGVIDGKDAKKVHSSQDSASWISANSKVVYALVKVGEPNQDLVITRGNKEKITVRNWHQGDLGINLTAATIQPSPSSVRAATSAKDYVHGDGVALTLLQGLAGPSALVGTDAAEIFDGGEGTDLVGGGAGRDTVRGGDGNDVLAADYTYWGGTWDPEYADWMTPSWFGDQLAYAFSEVFDDGDYVDAGTGDDSLFGGEGDDQLIAEEGSDLAAGGTGNDFIDGGADGDEILGDGPSEPLDMSSSQPENHGADVLVGGSGNDSIWGQGGSDNLYGGNDNDYLSGDSSAVELPISYHGDDLLDGGAGNDTLTGGGGNDSLFGGDGADVLRGDFPAGGSETIGGHDNLEGGKGDDVLHGGAGDDHLDGGDDNDRLRGDGGDDFLHGGAGVDNLSGGDGKDSLAGGTGFDVLDGGSGDDSLSGQDGNDLLNGGIGNDTLIGGAGNDTISGDDGNNVYMFGAGDGTDVISLTAGESSTLVLGGVSISELELRPTTPGGTNAQLMFNGGSILVGGLMGSDGQIRLSIQGVGGTLSSSKIRDLLLGSTSDGADSLYGLDTNDSLFGALGDDRIFGRNGDDTLVGGPGDDTLDGGAGSNVYRYSLGDGNDQIDIENAPGGSLHVLHLGSISMAQVSMQFADSTFRNVLVTIAGSADSVLINGFYDASGGIRVGVSTDVEVSVDITSHLALLHGVSSSEADSLYGRNNSNDSLFGADGDDVLYALSGDDTLEGGAGEDLLYGGNGGDTFRWGIGAEIDHVADYGQGDKILVGLGVSPADVIVQLDPREFPLFKAITLRIVGREDFLMIPQANSAHLRVEFESDGTVWDGAELEQRGTFGTAGDDQIYGGADDEYIAGWDGNDYINGGNGNDTLLGGASDDALSGGDGDDLILGGEGNDNLFGSAGNDTLVGGVGDDSISASSGTDVYRWGRGQGNDTIGYTWENSDDVLEVDALPSEVYVSMLSSDAVITIADSGNSIQLRQALAPTSSLHPWYGRATIDRIVFSDQTVWFLEDLRQAAYRGTPNADSTYGRDADDVISGLGGSDWLYSGNGNDTLNAGADGGALAGEAGDDTYLFELGGSKVEIWGGEGFDTLRLGAGISLGDVSARMMGGTAYLLFGSTGDRIELPGYYGIPIGGDAPIDRIEFSQTGTVLERAEIEALLASAPANSTPVFSSLPAFKAKRGQEFIYTIPEGLATDADPNSRITYSFNNVPDWLSWDPVTRTLRGTATSSDPLGSSELRVYADDELGARADEPVNLSLLTANRAPTVNQALSDRTAAVGANTSFVLSSSAFRDVDTRDELALSASLADGSALPSWLSFNAATRTFSGRSTAAGTITVRVTANDGWGGVVHDDFGLTSTLQNLSITGKSGNDSLSGSAGNDTLNGGAGVDTLAGSAGNDTYVVDSSSDVLVEFFGEGVDGVQSSVGYTLGAEIENLTLIGSNGLVGSGNDLDNVLAGNSGANMLTGNAGRDFLKGEGGNDTLYGGLGDDTLDGGAGTDSMVGGIGDDSYYLSASGDIVTEQLNEGIDTIYSSVAINSLASNVENLVITASAAVNGTGNALANVLTGGSGANTLTGAAGNDTLNGGAGSDVLIGGVDNDTYVFDRGYGTDQIQENDSTAGNTDVVQFLAGVASDQIWFLRNGNNLEVGIIGTNDKATIHDWYLGNQYQVERFKTADGALLEGSQVQNLVGAMASFTPPPAGQTTLPANYQSSLQPVIAANWGGG